MSVLQGILRRITHANSTVVTHNQAEAPSTVVVDSRGYSALLLDVYADPWNTTFNLTVKRRWLSVVAPAPSDAGLFNVVTNATASQVTATGQFLVETHGAREVEVRLNSVSGGKITVHATRDTGAYLPPVSLGPNLAEVRDRVAEARDRIGATTSAEATGDGSVIGILKRVRTLLAGRPIERLAFTTEPRSTTWQVVAQASVSKYRRINVHIWHNLDQEARVAIRPFGQATTMIWDGYTWRLDHSLGITVVGGNYRHYLNTAFPWLNNYINAGSADLVVEVITQGGVPTTGSVNVRIDGEVA